MAVIPAAMKARLQAEGRWGQYMSCREKHRKALLKDGWDLKAAAKEAYLRASVGFIEPLGAAESASGCEVGGGPALTGDAHVPRQRYSEAAGGQGDGMALCAPRSGIPITQGVVGQFSGALPGAGGTGAHTTTQSTPTAPAPGGGSDSSDDGLSKEFWRDKPMASAHDEVTWVHQNWSLHDVTAADAPSSGAWGMVVMMKADRTFRGEFYRTIFAKTLPNKQQLELNERYRDDGRHTDALFERLEQAIRDDGDGEARLSIWDALDEVSA